MEQKIGQYAVSVIITVAAGILFKFFEKPDGTSSISDIGKTRVVIILGFILGYVMVIVNAISITPVNIIIATIDGLFLGAAAIGLWKGLGVVNMGKSPVA